MSGSDWNELEQLWKSLPERAAPAADELRRASKWRWAAQALVVSDVVFTILGVAAGVWLLTQDNVYAGITGAAAIAFTLGAAGLSYWARQVRAVPADDPVNQALALAIRRARIGVRLAVAMMWGVCGGLLFTALVTLVRAYGPPASGEAIHSIAMVIGFTQLWLALCLAGAILYRRKREADLARLEALAASLNESP